MMIYDDPKTYYSNIKIIEQIYMPILCWFLLVYAAKSSLIILKKQHMGMGQN